MKPPEEVDAARRRSYADADPEHPKPGWHRRVVTPSEIAFLAVGLVLGAALGAAMVQLARAHPAPGREVRITITPNAIPVRRSHTLAVPFDTAHPGYIPGSPDAAVLGHSVLIARPAGSGTRPVAAADVPVIRTRVPMTPVALPAGSVAVPIAMAAGDTGHEAWAGLPAPRPSSGVGHLTADRVTPAPSL
jgi:hypothetical protein